ncbi:MAG: HAD hydrolase-like protein [Nostoc sp.]|uniref:HAD hydrolase-like protein n=1 Tax=Nostoc sp. TaxID=1180 RepID=UPI002FF1962F
MNILFVDIDGTLTETILGHTFKQHPQDVKIIEGADKAIAHFADLDWLIVGVSNQGGCAAINPETGKPRKTIEDTIAEMQFTLELLPQLTAIYFCPDFEGNDCWRVSSLDAYEISDREAQLIGEFRKPDAGMLKLAKLFAEDGGEDVDEIWMVGDRPEDEQCAINAGINFCPAVVWRDRFRAGIFDHQVTPKQLKFLEGIELGK